MGLRLVEVPFLDFGGVWPEGSPVPRSPGPQLQRRASCPLYWGVGLNRTALQWIPQIREFGVLSLGALLARNSSGSGKNLLSGGDPETNARPCNPPARPPSQPSRRS